MVFSAAWGCSLVAAQHDRTQLFWLQKGRGRATGPHWRPRIQLLILVHHCLYTRLFFHWVHVVGSEALTKRFKGKLS